ncbi:MAG: DUF4435 domain-containing protein [Chloroflexota bacterium]|nr:DUF4435 domain-containing protein [Chloroflexota bacterium]
MTRSLSLQNVYVEGDDDVAVLSRWFPRLQFKASGGKDRVGRKVEQDSASYGLLDRDFAPDGEVKASRETRSRIMIMQRYAIENYLLEPDIIAAAVKQLIPCTATDEIQAWLNEAHIQQNIHEWGKELALYAAANSIISEWRNTIMFDRRLGFLRYFGPLPPIPRAQVVESLQRRLTALTPADKIEAALDTRYGQVRTDLAGWDGLQRWINGKVLLEKYLYLQVFAAAELSQSRLRDLLIEAGRKHIPVELEELARRWTS